MSALYTLQSFDAIVSGEAPLPNATDEEPLFFLNSLAAGGHSLTPQWGWALVGGRKQWTQFFFRPSAMGGRGTFDGSGYAVTYGGSRWDQETKTNTQTPIVQRFAICKHEKEVGAGANPMRGWHPGKCKLCGLDMTVDSGD